MMNYLNFFFSLVFLFLFNLPSYAENSENDLHYSPTKELFSQVFESEWGLSDSKEDVKDHSENEADSFEAKFRKMLLILGCLIGLMIIAAWALKRMMKSRQTNLNSSSSIKVMETRNLSPRSTLYLIDVEGQILLIGETATTLIHLATLPQDESELVPEKHTEIVH